MEPIRSIEEVITDRFNVTAGRALHDRVLAHVRRADMQSKESQPALNRPVIRRIIMNSSNLKWAVAAAIVIALGAGFLGVWNHGGPAAYAFAQTVEAMQGRKRTGGPRAR
jgi:hypothetical protein